MKQFGNEKLKKKASVIEENIGYTQFENKESPTSPFFMRQYGSSKTIGNSNANTIYNSEQGFEYYIRSSINENDRNGLKTQYGNRMGYKGQSKEGPKDPLFDYMAKLTDITYIPPNAKHTLKSSSKTVSKYSCFLSFRDLWFMF